MPHTYKLIYFDSRGFGETARYILSSAGVAFEDARIKSDDWPALKPSMPFQALPVLEVDGVQIPQSSAINHFLAREYGLLGSNNLEEAQINVVYETLVETLNEARCIIMEKDETKKEELKATYVKETLKTQSERLVTLLEKNNNGNGFFVGNKLTLADIYFFAVRKDIIPFVLKDHYLENYPKLVSLAGRVAATPGIAAWIKKRPEA